MRKKRKKTPKAWWVLAVLLLCGAAALYYYTFVPSNREVSPFDEAGTHLNIDGEVIKDTQPPKIIGGEVLLTLETVHQYLDANIYWDEALKKVTVTTRDRVIRMKTDSLQALVNDKEMKLNVPVMLEGETVLVPVGFLSEFYGITVSYVAESNSVIIDHSTTQLQTAEPMDPSAVVRKNPTIRAPITHRPGVEGTAAGKREMRVFGEDKEWYKVRTWDGAIGYVQKKRVSVRNITVKPPEVQQEQVLPWKPANGKVNLVWDAIYTAQPELPSAEFLQGVDVLSPTWFQVVNEKGTVINRADKRYIDWAHQNGVKIWALVGNDTSNPAMTGKILQNTDTRQEIIRQLLAYAALYKLDGINVDFENINLADRDNLTQFIRELTPFMKEQGLVVSMDVNVPDGSDNWSRCYDHRALGEVVDYLAIMTYDQYGRTSSQPGSGAQVTWVEKNMKKLIELVKPEKLLLGVPLYAYIWEEKIEADGTRTLTSPAKAVPMNEMEKLIQDNHATLQWDAESGQFLASYTRDGAQYSIWLEDRNSINLKLSLVYKYQLAGAAAWRKSQGSEGIWETLSTTLKDITSYDQWQKLNQDGEYVFRP